MVDRVELALFDEPDQVREFEGQHTLVREDPCQAGSEVVEVGDVGEDVVAHEQVRSTSLRHQPIGEGFPEELRHGRDATILADGRDVARRLDTQDGNPRAHEVLQEVSVVAGNLHDETGGPQSEPCLHRARIRARVLDPGVGIRAEVGVLAKDLLGRDVRR